MLKRLFGGRGRPRTNPPLPPPDVAPAPGPGELTDATFAQAIAAPTLAVVDFWAAWCGPCKQLTPILEKAVKAARGKVKLVKMDIDKYPEIPGQMGIQSIPAVIAFVNGQPADGFMGAIPESQVTACCELLRCRSRSWRR